MTVLTVPVVSINTKKLIPMKLVLTLYSCTTLYLGMIYFTSMCFVKLDVILETLVTSAISRTTYTITSGAVKIYLLRSTYCNS